MSAKIDQMKKIRDEVLILKTSPLYTYRTENKYFPVIGEGSHDAQIMFVGEAPGRNEAKTGKPFCGAAGKILDELLASAGINRPDVYVTNIVKDRPPENRDPTPGEIESYGPFLDRQIEIIKPRVIATLGRYAMVYVMKKFGLDFDIEPIGQAHGKAYDAKASYGDIKIVALYHPCAAIYDRSKLPMLMKDIQVLKGIAR
ncbi:uracil-DNA glycosylase [Patescibacteria group bacterium]|nr:MAG: uracil-DNA glycosylase [Patescibacteria group bacterium]